MRAKACQRLFSVIFAPGDVIGRCPKEEGPRRWALVCRRLLQYYAFTIQKGCFLRRLLAGVMPLGGIVGTTLGVAFFYSETLTYTRPLPGYLCQEDAHHNRHQRGWQQQSNPTAR